MNPPTYADVLAAASRIADYTHVTPVFTSSYIDSITGAAVFLKAENLQKVGAFKARGAVNAVLSLSDDQAARGVVTHSSGNHGQAVAYACAIRGIPSLVVMPDHAPAVKVEAIRDYGAEIVFCPQSERESVLGRLVEEHGYTIVHPFNLPDVIAGQGTATLELLDQVGNLDVVIAPIGGGGLLSGASLVGEHRGVEVVGAEPELVDDAFRSLDGGVLQPATGAVSVGDGLLTGMGRIPFEILLAAGRTIRTVSEKEILDAMVMLAERTKLVVEPSGATAVAAAIRYANEFAGRRVGVILSGGNVDLRRFTRLDDAKDDPTDPT